MQPYNIQHDCCSNFKLHTLLWFTRVKVRCEKKSCMHIYFVNFTIKMTAKRWMNKIRHSFWVFQCEYWLLLFLFGFSTVKFHFDAVIVLMWMHGAASRYTGQKHLLATVAYGVLCVSVCVCRVVRRRFLCTCLILTAHANKQLSRCMEMKHFIWNLSKFFGSEESRRNEIGKRCWQECSLLSHLTCFIVTQICTKKFYK